MPAAKDDISIALRQASPSDEEFLVTVFQSACDRMLPHLPLDAAGKHDLIVSQYRAMTTSRRQFFPNCSREIVLVGDEPAGFLSVDRGETRIRIIDITLLPAFRNKGIGSRLLRMVLAEAEERRSVVDLRVEQNNPAKQLYERLGFTVVADDGVYAAMEWAH